MTSKRNLARRSREENNKRNALIKAAVIKRFSETKKDPDYSMRKVGRYVTEQLGFNVSHEKVSRVLADAGLYKKVDVRTKNKNQEVDRFGRPVGDIPVHVGLWSFLLMRKWDLTLNFGEFNGEEKV